MKPAFPPSDDLAKLPHLLALPRRAMRAITRNLLISLSAMASPGLLCHCPSNRVCKRRWQQETSLHHT